MKNKSTYSKPPRLAEAFVAKIAAAHLKDELLGDLYEIFCKRALKHGRTKAKLFYWLDVVLLLHPRLWRTERTPEWKPTKQINYPSPIFINAAMILNYFKIAFRNLIKNKGYSAINIGGLAVGMAVAMLTGLWLMDELAFNTYHENYDKIAQVRSRTVGEHGPGINSSLQYPLGTELKTNYAQYFKHIVMASWNVDVVLATDQNKVSRKGLYMEPAAPEMLSLKMRSGSWSGLKDANSILLSASTADALFGKEPPLNKLVKINNETFVKVTGVYADLPLNTEFRELKFISPFQLWESQNPWIKERAATDWDNHFLKVYVQIKPEMTFAAVTTGIKDAEFKNLGNFKEQAKLHPQVFLHPMADWHLRNFKRGNPDAEPMKLLRLVGMIGAVVLLLACINFMNLSTARSEKRSKEVGVRKAIGSLRIQLVSQFLSESFLVVILAFLSAVTLVYLALPWFNELVGKKMELLYFNAYYWLLMLIFVVVTALLAGSYPALYLSSFQPVKVLKGIFKAGGYATIPRQIFVVTQFSVSIILIIGAIIVYRQIQFAQNRPVGYEREGLIMIEMKSGDFYGKEEALRTELKNTGVVSEMSESMGAVTEVWSGNGGFEWRGKNPALDDSFGTLVVTSEYGKTIGWQFVKGRDFSKKFASDSSGMVVNEAAIRYMGLTDPIGEEISWKFQDQEIRHYKILGVVKDMVMESPYEPIHPTVFMIKAHGGVNTINIKLNPQVSAKNALLQIETVFKRLVPSAPFEYKFVDEEYARKFASEDRVGKLVAFFAVLAIFISCLGLLGLASFLAEQRTKEIGIRKVLGASISSLWQLLSKDFVLLVIISFLIASPTAYYFMHEWLQKYTYRTEISWWIFFLSGSGALLITLLTVSFQAIRAALLDPVHSLKNE